ncbi:hypothetical protein M5J20_08950 [Corynebacterium sp. TA-R-1]|uniref:Uncharacterized protein n=1 Tax=Corynebacterium stercoris TaxID=2943490 RepID=A0ABT1G2T7_9CORY|nr:hypothetical protein [Corynebacterium stercoris]MCP1388311.1 hypothetical protein [Corynebacterium stercoris]
MNLPANLRLDLHIISTVLGVLGIIAAIVGVVYSSGALHDDRGSSRGASYEVIDGKVDERLGMNVKDGNNVELPSTVIGENAKYFEELARQVDESIRKQGELINRQNEILNRMEVPAQPREQVKTDSIEETLRTQDDLIKRQEELLNQLIALTP